MKREKQEYLRRQRKVKTKPAGRTPRAEKSELALAEILTGKPDAIAKGLGGLSDKDLDRLRNLERWGQDRPEVSRAIADERIRRTEAAAKTEGAAASVSAGDRSGGPVANDGRPNTSKGA